VIQLAHLRGDHARWRAALVDALQEAFFICDEHAAVIEINAAFTEVLGYGPEGLPYAPIYPWWPDPVSDPDAHRLMTIAFAQLVAGAQGRYTIPINHRDGHRVWVSASFNVAEDPETGRRVTVGTFRDITAEHDAIHRESAIAGLVTSLAQAADLDDTVARAAHQLRDIWHAHRALAVLFCPGQEPAVIAGEPAVAWSSLPDDLREEIARVATRPLLSTLARDDGVGVLVEHPEGPLVLWLDLRSRRPFSASDRLLLTLLASHLTQAFLRARQWDQQRETALALQRAILGPATLPGGFVARYEPATPPLEVGGDWYDVVSLPGDRAGIVVGDCVGRGLPAAAVMGQLRSACRALLLRDSSPSRVLMELDQFAAGVAGAACSTVFCAILDPSTGSLIYSSAGHPPAIVIEPGGRRHLLDEGRSFPLAVRTGAIRTDARFTIPPRATFLLYTDGLVERRKRSILEGIDRAADVVEGARDRAVDEVADDVMRGLSPDAGYEDDVALLLYRHPAALEITFPADAEQLAPTRQALRRWLRQCNIPADAAQDVLTAAGEACTNAIEHGYRAQPGGPVRLRAEARHDMLRLVISDDGCWKTPRPRENPHRGRGITMMRAMMTAVDIVHDADGTTVDMQRRIA
jgi:PAS domain S-box-containing protein